MLEEKLDQVVEQLEEIALTLTVLTQVLYRSSDLPRDDVETTGESMPGVPVWLLRFAANFDPSQFTLPPEPPAAEVEAPKKKKKRAPRKKKQPAAVPAEAVPSAETAAAAAQQLASPPASGPIGAPGVAASQPGPVGTGAPVADGSVTYEQVKDRCTTLSRTLGTKMELIRDTMKTFTSAAGVPVESLPMMQESDYLLFLGQLTDLEARETGSSS